MPRFDAMLIIYYGLEMQLQDSGTGQKGPDGFCGGRARSWRPAGSPAGSRGLNSSLKGAGGTGKLLPGTGV